MNWVDLTDPLQRTIGSVLRTAHGRRYLVQPGEFPQFGPEHTVILRQSARVVSLYVDDMAVLNAHVLSPDVAGLYQAALRAKS